MPALPRTLAALALAAALPLAPASAAAPAPPAPVSTDPAWTVTNPYADVDWDSWGHYKASLHNHTTASDGTADAATMIETAYARGFHVFDLTDHDVLSPGWETSGALPAARVAELRAGTGRNGAPGMISLPLTTEQSRGQHATTMFTAHVNPAGATLEQTLAAVDAAGGISIVNHPGMYTGGWVGGADGLAAATDPATVARYEDLFTTHRSAVGLEVVNGAERWSHMDRATWDAILTRTMPARPVWAVASDDAHHPARVGTAWTVVLAPRLDAAAVRDALTAGTTYATATVAHRDLGHDFVAAGPAPTLARVTVDEDADTITLDAGATTRIEWFAGGAVVATGPAIDLDDHVGTVRSYVRAQLIGPGGITFTQPFATAGPDRTELFLLDPTGAATRALPLDATPADTVVLGDWDGDGLDTPAVRAAGTNIFRVSDAVDGSDPRDVAYGRPGDQVYVGDWDGNGTDTLGVRRETTFHLANTFAGGPADVVTAYGRAGDEVTIGRWTASPRDTPSVRRGTELHLKDDFTGGPADRVIAYGRLGDELLVGDWDGDGVQTPGIHRGTEFHLANTFAGGPADVVYTAGVRSDRALVGDTDGDGRDTVALLRAP